MHRKSTAKITPSPRTAELGRPLGFCNSTHVGLCLLKVEADGIQVARKRTGQGFSRCLCVWTCVQRAFCLSTQTKFLALAVAPGTKLSLPFPRPVETPGGASPETCWRKPGFVAATLLTARDPGLPLTRFRKGTAETSLVETPPLVFVAMHHRPSGTPFETSISLSHAKERGIGELPFRQANHDGPSPSSCLSFRVMQPGPHGCIGQDARPS
jgi:hypothetical protein